MHAAVQQTLYFADPWVPACMARLPCQAPYFPCTFVPMPSMPKRPMHACTPQQIPYCMYCCIQAHTGARGSSVVPCWRCCCCLGPVPEAFSHACYVHSRSTPFATMHAMHDDVTGWSKVALMLLGPMGQTKPRCRSMCDPTRVPYTHVCACACHVSI
jgi:hypothetical protein